MFEINTALVVGNREESDIDIFKIVPSGFAAQLDVEFARKSNQE